MAANGASGNNHRSAPVLVSASFAHPDVDAAARAVLSVPEDRLASALADLGSKPDELVVISTCLRHEVYAVGVDHSDLGGIVAEMAGLGGDDVPLPESVDRYGRDAVTHLFRVAAGLESPVVGEHEVLGQVRRAQSAAQRAGTLGPVLDQVFREAIRTGREVRDLLPAPDHGSLAAIAADHVLDREPGTVVLVGAGQMATAVADHLEGSGWEIVRVTRRPDRVLGPALGLDALVDALVDADVCVTAVTSARGVLDRDDLAAIVARRGRPLRVVDVGMPANVDGAGVEGVEYEGIDRLAADHRHSVAVGEATSVAEMRAVETHSRVLNSALTPLILSLREKADHAVDEELDRAFRRLDHLDPTDRAVIEQLARTLANRLMHDPLLYLSSHPQATSTSETARSILGIPET